MRNHIETVQSLPILGTTFPGLEALPAGVVYLMGCRSFSQFCSTLRSLVDPDRFCPFCAKELIRRGRRAEAISNDWGLFANEFPHKATKQMWLILPLEHVTDPNGLAADDWAAVGELLEVCRKLVGLKNGGVMFRFGDPKYNVGTIEHLHVNVIEPIPGKEYRPPFAKNVEEHTEDYQRMLGLRDEYLAKGGLGWLFSDEGVAETQPTVAK